MLNLFPAFCMPTPAKKLSPELNFEAAMDPLEAITEQMESGKMMLEELIVRYEEGMKLVKICRNVSPAQSNGLKYYPKSCRQAMVKEFEPKQRLRALPPHEKWRN